VGVFYVRRNLRESLTPLSVDCVRERFMSFLCRRLAVLMVVLLPLAHTPAHAQASVPVSVEFSLHAPDLPRGSKVYLSGGVPALGNWAPDGVAMDYQGNSFWRAVVIFPRAMSVEYHYTLGSDQRLAADDRGQPLRRLRIQTARNLVVSDSVTRWTDANTVVESRGQLSGDVRFHRHVRDESLRSRDLVVWLPRFYELKEKLDYPVLYLNDGQDLFDPATAEGGRDWQVDETVERLISEELIEPMIIVGIYSSDDRLEEYSPLGQGEAYMDFIVNRVKPLIDQRYRTRPGRENTLVGGAAMGGLIAFATAWRYPELFGGVISLSPAFQLEGRIDSLPWFLDQDPAYRPVFFYLYNGSQGADALLEPGVLAMTEQLKAWGYRPERNYVLDRDLDADHGIEAWAKQFPDALTRTLRGARRLETLADINAEREQRASLSRPAHVRPVTGSTAN